jgi:hypothetical protein
MGGLLARPARALLAIQLATKFDELLARVPPEARAGDVQAVLLPLAEVAVARHPPIVTAAALWRARPRRR